MKLICQECKGYGEYKEVLLDDGTGPIHRCGWCNGTGYMTPHNRGLWLRMRKADKAREEKR